MTDSEIIFSKSGGVSYSGPDAMRTVQAITLWSAIGLIGTSGGRIQPTRGFTMKKALDMATSFTGKKYKRTEWEKARADVKKWADEMKAAIPQTITD